MKNETIGESNWEESWGVVGRPQGPHSCDDYVGGSCPRCDEDAGRPPYDILDLLLHQARHEIKTGEKKYEGRWEGYIESLVDYYKKRANGDHQDWPEEEVPFSGQYSWTNPDADAQYSTVTYTEGRGDREWMLTMDRNYVMRLEREGSLDDVEPDLEHERPELYREVMAARHRLAAERRTREERERRERQAAAERTRLEAERERIARERRIPANVFAAVKSGNLEPLTILLHEEYDFKIIDKAGNNLLHTAILAEKTEVALWLIENAGLDLDAVSEAEDRTALHYAALKDCLDVVKALVAKKVNVFIEDGLDETARDLAIENRHVAIATLLKKEMKKGRAASGTPSTPSGSRSLLPPTPTGGAGAGGGGRAKTPEPKVHADSGVTISLTIPYEELSCGAIPIGRGSYGVVWPGKWRGKDIAFKELLYQSLSDVTKDSLIKEAAKMAQLVIRDDEAKIVRVYGVCAKPMHYGIVTELAPRGSLYSLLQNRSKELPWRLRLRIAADIVQGLKLIHDEGMLHRDLKSLNILLDGSLRAKINDFGFSDVKKETKAFSTAQQSVVGTFGWMAPETFGIRPVHSVQSDVYSCAIVFWELAACELPYAGVAESEVIEAVRSGEREEIPHGTPPEFAELIISCWNQRAHKRPTTSQLALSLSSLASQGIFAVGGGAGAAGVSVAPASAGDDYSLL